MECDLVKIISDKRKRTFNMTTEKTDHDIDNILNLKTVAVEK